MKFQIKTKVKLPRLKIKKPLKLSHPSGWLGKIKGFFSKFQVVIDFFKRPKVRKVIIVTLTVFGILLFVAEATFAVMIYGLKNNSTAVKWVAKIVPYPLAIVNFRPVTLAEYNFELSYIQHFYDQSQKEMPAGINSQVVDQLIENKILFTQANRYNVKVTSTEIDQTINDLIDQNGGQTEVEKVLNSYYGLSLKDFRKLVQSQLLRSKMKEAVPVQLHASHILIKADANADAATLGAAKAKADDALAKLKAGADFAETAKNISDDTGSRDQGGDLGWFSYGDMVKPFEDAAFKLDLNQLSDPIRTDYGWHIIKVSEKKGYVKMNFDDWLKKLRGEMVVKQLVQL